MCSTHDIPSTGNSKVASARKNVYALLKTIVERIHNEASFHHVPVHLLSNRYGGARLAPKGPPLPLYNGSTLLSEAIKYTLERSIATIMRPFTDQNDHRVERDGDGTESDRNRTIKQTVGSNAISRMRRDTEADESVV